MLTNIPATISSAIIPVPLGNLSIRLIGKGFRISSILKRNRAGRPKPEGRLYIATHIPATSSITTSEGSSILLCSLYLPAQYPPKRTNGKNTRTGISTNLKIIKAATDPKVPGILENLPIYIKVATISSIFLIFIVNYLCKEIVFSRFCNFYGNELTFFQKTTLRKILNSNHSINLRSISIRPSPYNIFFRINVFYQNIHCFSFKEPLPLKRYLCLNFHKPVISGLFDLIIYNRNHSCSRCTLLRIKRKRSNSINSILFQKIQNFFKLTIRLTRESYNKGSSKSKIWVNSPRPCEKLIKFLFATLSVHCSYYIHIYVLYWRIKVRQNIRGF